MAKKSLADLQAQIQKLQAEAEALKQQEKAGVVARIREAIAAYELTAADLFGAAADRAMKGKKRAGRSAARGAAYADGSGNVWGGRGPRPRWLREALQQGKSLEDFAAGARPSNPATAPLSAAEAAEGAAASNSAGSASVRRPRAAKKAPRGAAAKAAEQTSARYQDDAGNRWSGRGPQPKWLKEALAGGKTLESFQVQG